MSSEFLTSQTEKTKSFVAQHLRYAHKGPLEANGCMICTAWSWARETRSMDDNEVKALVDGMKSVVEVHQP